VTSWTRVFTPFAFDAFGEVTCQHHDGDRTPSCGRPALYRAELDDAFGPDGSRVITGWCAEHAALWRTFGDVPLRLIATLEAVP
jgi:hypothetical protein